LKHIASEKLCHRCFQPGKNTNTFLRSTLELKTYCRGTELFYPKHFAKNIKLGYMASI